MSSRTARITQVTYRSRNDSKTTVSSRPSWHGWQLTKLGAWSTLHSLWAAQQAGKCHFQVTDLKQLSWFWHLPHTWSCLKSLLCNSVSFLWEGLLVAFIVYSVREGPSESGYFQGLPEAILSCLPSYFRSSEDRMFQSQRKLLYNSTGPSCWEVALVFVLSLCPDTSQTHFNYLLLSFSNIFITFY